MALESTLVESALLDDVAIHPLTQGHYRSVADEAAQEG